MKNNNKQKRTTISIPEGTTIFNFLYDTHNNHIAKWELLDQLVKHIPQSRQDRAFTAYKHFMDELESLYPGTSTPMNLIWPLISKRILKIPDMEGKEAFLSDSFFTELKKL